MRTIDTTLAIILAATALTSCHHKDLAFDDSENTLINVVYDWSLAPDANPASMGLYLYDRNTSAEPLRYIFSDRFGGQIRVPYGLYDGLSLNSDINDWARMRNTSDIETFEIYTPDAAELTAYGLSSRSVPRARGTEDERVAATPGMLWTTREDRIDINATEGVKTITLYPEEAVCHYTVDILDVKNLDGVHGTTIDGILSGMAEGFLHGKKKASDNHVTMPFVLTADASAGKLHSEFLTFGERPERADPHTLTIYMFLTDGTKWYYNFDVTRQVADAPDPRHVHIVVSGITLPESDPSVGGGLIPDVNDWQTEDIEIQM